MSFRLSLRIGVVLSVLILVILIDHSIRAVNNFYTFKETMGNGMVYLLNDERYEKDKDFIEIKNKFHKLTLNSDIFRFMLRAEFKKSLVRLSVTKPVNDAESALETFYLNVAPEDLGLLNSDLPESGKAQTVDALMRTSKEQNIWKVKLRYRGDMNYHWLYPQKSMRIEFKDDLYDMNTKINLINPPFLHSFRDIANYQISKELGILGPDYYPVRVFLNHKYMGVYIYLNQIDESLLRKNKRMPGSIYYGDGAPLDKDGIRNMWADEKFWEKKGARNAEQKNNREDIKQFVEAVKLTSDKFYNFTERLIDKEKFFSYIALDRITGTYHHDYNHNHKVYFDPYKGKFEPIQWDLNNWNNIPEKDLSLNPLLLKFKENPIYDAEIDKKVYEFYYAEKLEKMTGIYKSIADDSLQDLSADKYRDMAVSISKMMPGNWYSIPFTLREFNKLVKNDISAINARKIYMMNLLEDSTVEYSIKKKADKYHVTYKISGNSPVKLTIDDTIKNKMYKIYKNKKFKLEEYEILYSGRKTVPTTTAWLRLYGKIDVVSVPLYYTFEIDSISDLDKIIYTNYITDKEMKLTEIKANHFENNELFHPWSLLELKISKNIVLSGTVIVNETMEFSENENVEIKPATTFLMSEGQSIYFYGKVTAIGTKEEPIRFISKDENKPWGLIAVQGKKASGSIFDYVRLDNGSVDSKDLIQYTAPFNIHNVDWFEVKNSYIGRNFVGDDAMHIAYANGVIDNCLFENARSDGLDIDIADVVVTNSIFYNSGNDGLDIMTTKANIRNNVFFKTGDKGVSVGEWSTANVDNNLFYDNEIALEIKDKSSVNTDNNIVINARKVAVNLYNKNKRYDEGGEVYINNIYLTGNLSITKDKKSIASVTNKINSIPDFKEQLWYENILENKLLLDRINALEEDYAK